MFVEVTAIIQDGEEFDNPLGKFEDRQNHLRVSQKLKHSKWEDYN